MTERLNNNNIWLHVIHSDIFCSVLSYPLDINALHADYDIVWKSLLWSPSVTRIWPGQNVTSTPRKSCLVMDVHCSDTEGITSNYGKFFKRWEYQTTLPASWEIYMQVKKQQLEPDVEQWASSKLGKEYMKVICCHPVYLTSVQSISCEMPGWMKHKLESRLPGEISITSDMPVTPPLWQKAKRN